MFEAIRQILTRNVTTPLWMAKDGRPGIRRLKRRFVNAACDQEGKSSSRQWLSLATLVHSAAQNVPYYKELFGDKIFVDSKISTQLFAQLPILTKEIVREQGGRLLDVRYDEAILMHATTGGSTGTPMEFWRTNRCVKLRKAQELFYDEQMGLRWGKKVALFVSASHVSSGLAGIKAAIRNATCERMLRFDPRDVSERYLRDFRNEFEKFRPEYIKCFPNSLRLFANYVDRQNVQYDFVNAISVTGESTYGWQLDLFERVFGCPVYERYGTKECGVIAGQCPERSGMHIFLPGVYVEIVDQSGIPVENGWAGDIVVTDLFNEAMPLIRYKIGDRGVLGESGPCSCGMSFVKLDQLMGRNRDVLVDSRGVPRPGYLFVELVGKHMLDAKFQFVQHELHVVEIRVVSDHIDDSELSNIVADTREILGPDINVYVTRTNEISRDPSGKYSYVLSKIDGLAN